jgi:hypothetical protein
MLFICANSYNCITRKTLCIISSLLSLGGSGTLIYGATNLPSKLPDEQTTFNGQVYSRPSSGSAQDLQNYIYQSFEFKLVIIGTSTFMGFLLLSCLICWCCASEQVEPVEAVEDAVLVVPPSIKIRSATVVPFEPKPQIQIVSEVRIRAPSSSSPQLTLQKINAWT